MRRFFNALAFVNVTLLGCNPPASSGGAAPSAAAPASAAAETPAPPSAPVAMSPAPENLNVAELQKTLKCASSASSGACGVLTKFSTACTAWTGVAPAGDGRWFGRGYVIQGGKTTEQITLLRSRRVPSTEVGPGQVAARLSVAELPKEAGLPFEHADRTIRIFERIDVPKKADPTIEYIKQRTDWPEVFATRTTGGHVYAISQAGTYVCQGPKQQLFMVQRAATRGGSGDGIYAELWAATW